MGIKKGVAWAAAPEEHDYPAAADYLSLLAPPEVVTQAVEALRHGPSVHHKAKDILRASGLPLLPADNAHVASDLAKIDKGKSLSPVLIVAGDLTSGTAATIADGYHRVCASYLRDENTEIPCRVAPFPG